MKGSFRVVDADRHVIEPPWLWDKYLPAEYRGRVKAEGYRRTLDGRPFSTADAGANSWVSKSSFFGSRDEYRRVFADPIEHEFDSHSNLRSMDREGIDLAVHFPTYGLYIMWVDDIEPRFSGAICRAYNDWMADFCAVDKSRLKGVALIPLHDPVLAIAEMRRAKLELGLCGVMVRPNPLLGRNLGDAAYDPVYEAASVLGMPILMHEGLATMLPQLGDGRVSPFGQHIACHSMEQMMACLQFCGEGVLERHPELKVGFFESGSGWLPFWLDRMDEHWEHAPAFGAAAITKEPPSVIFKRQCVISCEAGDAMVDIVADKVGEDYIVMASDYPHPDAVEKFPDRVVGDLLAMPTLSEVCKRKILWDNPVRFFGLS